MRAPIAATALFVALLSSGCGLTGGTSTFVLDVKNAIPPAGSPTLAVGSLTLDQTGVQLTSIGVYRWGRYSPEDLANLEQSLKETLATASGRVGTVRLHVVVRSFLVAASNSEGGALACVAWAATDEKGALLFHEQFYAARMVRLTATLGAIKNSVQQAIVRRVVETAVRLTPQGMGGSFQPLKVDRTFNTFEEVAPILPPVLSSFYVTMFKVGGGYSFSSSSLSGGVQWDFAKRPENVNWPEYLKRHGGR